MHEPRVNAPLTPRAIQPGIDVLVRGWLNCNQIVLRDGAGTVLVDTGYVTHAARTLAGLASMGVAPGVAPLRILNTHCHSDHMGGNAALQRAFAAPIVIPEGELRHIRPWSPQSFWLAYFGQQAEPFEPDETIAAGATFAAAGRTWEAIAAPGHDMDALMFFEPRSRILITGDALWQSGMGFVWPGEDWGDCMAAALATLAAIERLRPALILPGHGEPFAEVAAALDRTRARLEAFAADPAKNAWNIVKVMFSYALLDMESIADADVAAHLGGIGSYRDLNATFLMRDPAELARQITTSLERSGTIRRQGDAWVPTITA